MRSELWQEWRPTKEGLVMDADVWARNAERDLENQSFSSKALREALKEVSQRTARRTLGQPMMTPRPDLKAGRRR